MTDADDLYDVQDDICIKEARQRRKVDIKRHQISIFL